MAMLLWRTANSESRSTAFLRPRMFKPLRERPHGSVQRSWHTILFTPLHNRAIHEVDLARVLGKHILQHTGLVLAWSIRPLSNQISGIAVQLDAHRPRHRLALLDEPLEQLACRRKTRCRPMMQSGERPDWIRG